MTADQPTTEPSEDAVVEAVAKALADDWNPDRDSVLTAMFRDYAQTAVTAAAITGQHPDDVERSLRKLFVETEVQWGVRTPSGRLILRADKRDAWRYIEKMGGTLVSIREDA